MRKQISIVVYTSGLPPKGCPTVEAMERLPEAAVPEGVEAEALRRGWGAAERALEKWLAYALLPGGPLAPGGPGPGTGG